MYDLSILMKMSCTRRLMKLMATNLKKMSMANHDEHKDLQEERDCIFGAKIAQ